jgi:hypothetical protein
VCVRLREKECEGSSEEDIYIYIYREERERERERDDVNMSHLFLPASSCLATTNYETCHVLIPAVFYCVTFKIAKLKPPAVFADAGRKDD